MKKTTCLMLSLILTVGFLSSCSDTHNKNIDSETVCERFDTTQENSSLNTETNIAESPVEDFEYKENEDGGITITRYMGNDKDVVIPKVIQDRIVTKIGNISFHLNSDIYSVTIPDSVVEIGGGAFASCRNLKTVSLSTQLESIGNGAFEKTAITTITFPQDLKSIGMRAFADCMNLKQVTIPKLSHCGEETFCGSGLETVTIEEGLETIPTAMFASTNIKEIIFPKSVKTICMNAFGSCKDLESVVLNEGLFSIDTYAFSNTKLMEIVIPKSVINLKNDAFLYCSNLQKVKFEGDAPNEYRSEFVDSSQYVIYYHKDSKGFTSPQWNGYPTEIW